MILYLVAGAGLICLIAGALLISTAAGLIALGAALLTIYLVLVNRPEG